MDSKGEFMRTTFDWIEMSAKEFEARLKLWAEQFQVEVIYVGVEKIKPTRKTDPVETIVTALVKRTEG